MNIYVASSWRNKRQPNVVDLLRIAGHDVYDFRNPKPGNNGFSWKQIDKRNPSDWSIDEYKSILKTEISRDAFSLDMEALRKCDACVLVLPCGRSAHLELGFCVGQGKKTLVLCDQFVDEPELMYLTCTIGAESICNSIDEVVYKLWNM